MAVISLTLDKTIPTVADLMDSPLAKCIILAANDCGYSGKVEELIGQLRPSFILEGSLSS